MKNIGELIQGSSEKEKDHLFEISEKILNKEVPLEDTDEELDAKWYEENYDE